jgi:hypothetical protein
MREYLRRMALWKNELQSGAWPFFDVAGTLKPDIHTNIQSPKFDKHFKEIISFVWNPLMIKTCQWYLHWAILTDTGTLAQTILPEPYEPLIWMYERGGHFYTEHGFIQVLGGAFRIGNTQDYISAQPFAELNTEWLNALDD